MKIHSDLPYWLEMLDEEMKRQLAITDRPKESNVHRD